MGGLPWETYPHKSQPAGKAIIGWAGFWGTTTADTDGSGYLRGCLRLRRLHHDLAQLRHRRHQ